MPTISADYRFRLGVPSYVYPADILPNVEALAPFVDDIEILLFESETRCNLPSPETIERLRQLADLHDLTYTVHFPFDRQLGSPLASERLALQQQILKIIKLTQPITPFAYILHIEGIDAGADHQAVQSWQGTVSDLLPPIIRQTEDPTRICVENTCYPFKWCEGFLDTFGLSVCMDIGHLWRFSGDVHQHFQRYQDRIRVIHLHGFQDEHAHRPLTVVSIPQLREVLNSIDNFTGVLTLELFNSEDLRQSMARLAQCLNPSCDS